MIRSKHDEGCPSKGFVPFYVFSWVRESWGHRLTNVCFEKNNEKKWCWKNNKQKWCCLINGSMLTVFTGSVKHLSSNPESKGKFFLKKKFSKSICPDPLPLVKNKVTY